MAISADRIRELHKYEIRILLILERLMPLPLVLFDIIKKTVGLSGVRSELPPGQADGVGFCSVRYRSLRGIFTDIPGI